MSIFQQHIRAHGECADAAPSWICTRYSATGIASMSLLNIRAGGIKRQTSCFRYMTLAEVPPGPGSNGAVFATSMQWHSTSSSTIEGCVRMHSPHNTTFAESMLLSTGWEDYYISSWGMIQGAWQGELSGTTQWSSPANRDVSAYRFHTQDPLFFQGGLRLILRNGDAIGPNGKCTLETGGGAVGVPGVTDLSVYAWVYVWD